MKIEHAMGCINSKLNKYYGINGFRIPQPDHPNDPDYIDKVFGRDWFFCKCKPGMEKECERGFRSKPIEPCRIGDDPDGMCVIS